MGRRWSKEEDEHLMRMVLLMDFNASRIAAKLSRTVVSIYNRCKKLKIKLKISIPKIPDALSEKKALWEVRIRDMILDVPTIKACTSENISLQLIDIMSRNGIRGLAMLEAYIDESGTGNTGSIVSVACYMGTPEQWAKFLEEWQPIIGNARISYFHAKDPICDPLRPHLLRLIRDCGLRGVVVTVDKAVYRNYSNDHTKSKIGNAYAACTMMCVIEAAQWAKKNNIGPIGYFIEYGQPNDEYVENILKASMEAEENFYNIKSISLVGKDFQALAAPDFLSHICSTGDHEWMHKIDIIGNHVRGDVTKEQLEEAGEKIKKLVIRQRTLRKNEKRKQRKSRESVSFS